MKNSNRLSELESNAKGVADEQPKDALIKFGKQWSEAIISHDKQAALSAREMAQPIFDEHPDFLDEAPHGPWKMLYIDWQWFVKFTNPAWRRGYWKAVEENKWPPRPIKEDTSL